MVYSIQLFLNYYRNTKKKAFGKTEAGTSK